MICFLDILSICVVLSFYLYKNEELKIKVRKTRNLSVTKDTDKDALAIPYIFCAVFCELSLQEKILISSLPTHPNFLKYSYLSKKINNYYWDVINNICSLCIPRKGKESLLGIIKLEEINTAGF